MSIKESINLVDGVGTERLRCSSHTSTGQTSALPHVVTQHPGINNLLRIKPQSLPSSASSPDPLHPGWSSASRLLLCLQLFPPHAILGARCFCFFLIEPSGRPLDAYLVSAHLASEHVDSISKQPRDRRGPIFCISCVLTVCEVSRWTRWYIFCTLCCWTPFLAVLTLFRYPYLI